MEQPMYEWTEPYEDEYLKERIEELNRAQALAIEHGRVLVSEYEQLWLPVLNDLPEIQYLGRGRYRAPYGTFEPAPDVPFHGALWFTPAAGVELPPALRNGHEWHPASASLDANARLVKIQAGESEISFTNVNINLRPHDLLRDLNSELVRVDAGACLWKIQPVKGTSASVHHLYPDGAIPALANAHTRADVTGYALLEDRPYQHSLIYVGLAAHKTSVESLWASLIRGRGSCSMRSASLVPDGAVRMVTQPLAEFNVMHAGLISRKALPGQWEAGDDCAYALLFGAVGDTEAALQAIALKRLQEALPFPVLDEWAKVLWNHGLDAGFIQRLETAGDCRGGTRIDLTKPWQELVQELLEQEALRV
jgi:hypothetical protein